MRRASDTTTRPWSTAAVIGMPVGVAVVGLGHVVGLIVLTHPAQALWGAASPGLIPLAAIVGWTIRTAGTSGVGAIDQRSFDDVDKDDLAG